MKIQLKKNTRTFSITSPLKIKVARLQNVLPYFLLLLVIVFILYPIVTVIANSFIDNGAFTVKNYISAFTSSSTYKALLNTIKLVFIVLIGTWLFGGSLAFIRQKTDFKYKKSLDILVFLSFTIPSYILSVSWIEVVGRGGYLNRILKIFNPLINYNINAYSITSSAIILAIHLYPMVYYGVCYSLKIMNSPLEQSAKICGANKLRVIFTVVLPLVIPSFISTGLLVISRSMANFGVTAQLALPVGKEVLTTRIFSALSDLNMPIVFVLSMFLMLISSLIFLYTEKILKKRNYNLTPLNKNNNQSLFKLGKSKILVNTAVFVFYSLTILVPLITILISSFMKRWGVALEFKNLTLQNYAVLFTGDNILGRPLLNSLFYGTLSAVIATFIGSLIVYLDKYTNNRKTKLLMNISQLPIAIPNMVLAISYMFAWINEPFKLYGTSLIIIATYTVLFVPICIKQMLGISKNIDQSLDSAAQTMGIPLLSRYFNLFLPQIKDNLISGFLICFLISLREIPISLLLYTAGTKTLGVMLFTIQSNSYGLEMTSTIAVVVIILSLIGNIFLRKLGAKRGRNYE